MINIYKNIDRVYGNDYYVFRGYERRANGEKIFKYVNVDFQNGIEPGKDLQGNFFYETTDGVKYLAVIKPFRRANGETELKVMLLDEKYGVR